MKRRECCSRGTDTVVEMLRSAEWMNGLDTQQRAEVVVQMQRSKPEFLFPPEPEVSGENWFLFLEGLS